MSATHPPTHPPHQTANTGRLSLFHIRGWVDSNKRMGGYKLSGYRPSPTSRDTDGHFSNWQTRNQ